MGALRAVIHQAIARSSVPHDIKMEVTMGECDTTQEDLDCESHVGGWPHFLLGNKSDSHFRSSEKAIKSLRISVMLDFNSAVMVDFKSFTDENSITV